MSPEEKSAPERAFPIASGVLCGFACSDPIGGRGLDLECPDDGLALQEMLQRIVDLWVLFPMVALGIFFAIPEAKSEDLIRLRVRHQNRLIYEACLPLQNGHDLLLNSVAEFACLAGFAGNFNDSRIHGSLLSVGEKCERNVAQEARRPLFCWNTDYATPLFRRCQSSANSAARFKNCFQR